MVDRLLCKRTQNKVKEKAVKHSYKPPKYQNPVVHLLYIQRMSLWKFQGGKCRNCSCTNHVNLNNSIKCFFQKLKGIFVSYSDCVKYITRHNHFLKSESYNIGALLDILHAENITNPVSSSQGVTSHSSVWYLYSLWNERNITDFLFQPQIFISVSSQIHIHNPCDYNAFFYSILNWSVSWFFLILYLFFSFVYPFVGITWQNLRSHTLVHSLLLLTLLAFKYCTTSIYWPKTTWPFPKAIYGQCL